VSICIKYALLKHPSGFTDELEASSRLAASNDLLGCCYDLTSSKGNLEADSSASGATVSTIEDVVVAGSENATPDGRERNNNVTDLTRNTVLGERCYGCLRDINVGIVERLVVSVVVGRATAASAVAVVAL